MRILKTIKVNFLDNRMTRLCSVSNRRQKQHIQELLTQHKIPYRLKVRENRRMSLPDAAALGSLGHYQLHLTYHFYVRKADADWALRLIRSHN